MKYFFEHLDQDLLTVDFEEIVPASHSPESYIKRAVYKGLVNKLPDYLKPEIKDTVESLLRSARRQTLGEGLSEDHFARLLDHFQFFKTDFRERMVPFEAYRMINCCAALMAQILFVDNCRKQGIMNLSHPDNRETINRVSDYIASRYQESEKTITRFDAEFYAHFFLVQTLFDRIFVGDEEILRHDPETGDLTRTPNYDFYTSYLELSNRKILTASQTEKDLCFELTTGWGDGIDVVTWNALNKDYYSKQDDNFFSSDYDDHLDKMIPQFPYGRTRAARTIAGTWDGEQPLNLIEIGAGSGAFAVDVFMALKHGGKDFSRFSYRGVEPSPEMKTEYPLNFERRTGRKPPSDWCIETAGLEEFLENYRPFLREDATNLIVFSYSAHHCYHPSIVALLDSAEIQARVETIYTLDATEEHGWTKVYYMPLDCRSPENFTNPHITRSWSCQTLWHEPFLPMEDNTLSRAWCALRRLTSPAKHLIAGKEIGLLIDLDGTIFADQTHGAAELLEYLEEQKIPFRLISNRSDRTPAEICEHLASLGIPAPATQSIYTSAQATAAYLAGGHVHILGGKGLMEALADQSFSLDQETPECVVVGFDATFNYSKLQQAAELIRGGARFVASDSDSVLAHGAPGNGAAVAAIAAATGKQPEVVGLPGPFMLAAAAGFMNRKPRRILLVGQNPTHFWGAQEIGLKTVQCGEMSEQRLADDVLPDLTIETLADLRELLLKY